MINLCILGSTGSIGRQALEVLVEQSAYARPYVLTANYNADLLIEQAIQFQPAYVVIVDERNYTKVKEGLANYPIEVLAGREALCSVVQLVEVTHVLTALVGFAGLEPTLKAIQARKTIALANKETLVVAGQLIQQLALQYQVPILPVDSEHSALFQCIVGEAENAVEKIYLTASGGPFRNYSYEQLHQVTKAQALKHPNWSMGQKITIDSATLMNKGLEVIEAKWLFNLSPEQIEVIVHPQSIIHSLVQFEDGSIKAQMGLPDMKLPIQYALSYPKRWKNNFPRFNFLNYPSLTFEAPNTQHFPCLALAFESLRQAGNMPCSLNAANEIAVELFLKEQIPFLKIPELIEQTLARIPFITSPTLEDLLLTDQESRNLCRSLYVAL